MRTDVFGIPIQYKEWEKQNTLPLYIAGNYKFYTALIDEYRCIMITPIDVLATIPALKKQISRIQEVDSVPVVLELPTISRYRRKSLIENRIPFVTQKQIFLPFMGTFLTDENEKQMPVVRKFMASTQQLFLFYLYNRENRLYVSKATEYLPFTAMTMSRAVKQLEAANLFIVVKDGVNKVIESDCSRSELFEKAKEYLSSPVRKSGYVEKSYITSDMVMAGETMLSERTMLNPGRNVTYAVYEKSFDKSLVLDELVDPDKQICLELWSYDPRLFSQGELADGISVALSLENNTDERVEEAVEELLKEELEE